MSSCNAQTKTFADQHHSALLYAGS